MSSTQHTRIFRIDSFIRQKICHIVDGCERTVWIQRIAEARETRWIDQWDIVYQKLERSKFIKDTACASLGVSISPEAQFLTRPTSCVSARHQTTILPQTWPESLSAVVNQTYVHQIVNATCFESWLE